MSDVSDLEKTYLAKDGIPASDDSVSVPADFRELFTSLQDNPDARAADRQVRIANIRRLIVQLESADNQVVKMQKRRVIRAEFNAIAQLDAMAD